MSLRGLALFALPGILALTACTGRSTSEQQPAFAACTGCHGSGTSSAPPLSAHRASATSDPGVGAHQAHVNPGPFRKAVACEECHPVPQSVTAPGHNDGKTDVVFGGLAKARGAVPVFDPGTLTTPPSCSSVYCHGATLHGGTNTSPQWNKVDGTQVACGTCHGVPPQWAGHPPPCPSPSGGPCVPATTPSTAACNLCHPGTVRADGTLDIAGGLHIDGLLQIGARACTACHGDINRTPIQLAPAPPRDTAPDGLGTSGNTSTSALGVGAHLAHLTGTSLRSSPIACGECHAVPSSLASHPKPRTPTPVPDMTWGPLATAGGAAPSWDRASATCSATYCHGGTLPGGTVTAPRWTQVDGTQVQCGSCHGLPPVFGGHPPMCPAPVAGDPCVAVTTPPTASCNECHRGTVRADGTLDLASGLHIDGWVELDTGASGTITTCTSCHGDPNKPATIHAAPPRDTSGNTSTTARGVGAHDKHLTGTSLSSSPVACSECHPAVTRTDHAAGGNFDVVMVWGPLATAGGSWPVWDPGTLRCSSTYCHGSTLSGGSAPAPLWTQVNGTQAACGACHGIPPPDPHPLRQDCSTCHAGYTATSVNLATHLDGIVDATGGSCTSCHGDPSRTPAAIAAAPPVNAGTATSPWATSDPGAHQKHLAGTLLRAQPIACAECHQVPAGPPGPPGAGDTHGDGAATLVFGALASTGGANPSFNPGSLGCSATYCHGGANPAWGGTRTTPVWNVVDGTYSACGTCHANPPATTSQLNPVTGQPGIHPDVAPAQNCNGCHTGYSGVLGGAISVNSTLHMNGVVDATNGTGSCASCHGDPTRVRATGQDARVASAPPANALLGPGVTPPWNAGDPGAHLAHLTGTTLRSSPIACRECHTVPSNYTVGTHRNGTADVVWGSLARSSGASPAWSPAGVPLGCSATYCHGATLVQGPSSVATPTWNGTSAQVSCGACHGVPPPNPTHSGLPPGTACSGCHTGYGGTVGGAPSSFTVNKAVHLDGTVDAAGGSCTSCHGNAARTLVAGADPQTLAAPPNVAAPGPYAGDAIADPNSAHFRHLNHARSTAISVPVACSECHVTPSGPPGGGADTHGNGLADIAFGTLARANGAAPTSFTAAPGAAAPSCSATYCHGGTLAGGTRTAPVWNVVDGTQVACTACHGMPPATVAGGARPHPASSGTDCGSCHGGYTATTVNVGLHVNGTVDASTSCTSCHGTAGRVLVTGADPQTASAPPIDAAGSSTPAPWANYGTGAHQAHLNKGTGAIGAHVACSECHSVPSAAPAGGTDPHGNGVANFAPGPRSRTGGANPTYRAGSLTQPPSCSATYCHGQFTVNPNSQGKQNVTIAWNAPGPLACSACHNVNASGVPVPNDSCHPPNFNHDGGNSCQSCHRNANGTNTSARITNATTHVDGVVNGKCTDCHRNENRVCQ